MTNSLKFQLTFGTCLAGQDGTVETPSQPHSLVQVHGCSRPADTKHHFELKEQILCQILLHV